MLFDSHAHYNDEKFEEDRFDVANKDLTKVNMFVNRMMSCMMPMMMFVMNAISVLIVWVGAKNIDTGAMQVGDMMAFIQYTMQIVMSFLMISMVSVMMPRAAVSANRIDEVLTTDISIKEVENVEKFDDDKKGLVEFKNVSFKFPDADEKILHDISFTAKPGQTTAFIGSTGSGKSTLINLIPRFYDVTEGEIKVDGINIKNASIHDLREKIGYVPQKGVLFSGTIESNIKYGNKNAGEDLVETASRVAQATEFIDSKPDRYETPISQGGSNVSGGQKQRLSIARAILKNSPILLLDEATASLDIENELAVKEAIANLLKNKKTVIMIAHTLSIIKNADKIVVVSNGKIAEEGTHETLLKKNGKYAAMWNAEQKLSI